MAAESLHLLCGVIRRSGGDESDGADLPLYIEELGVTGAGEVARWSGIVYGCNFVSLAIFSPIWGRLADRYGRKPMILRASCWLGLIMIGMSFAQSVWHLVALRLLQGCL